MRDRASDMVGDKVGCKWRAMSAGEKDKILEDKAQINL